MRRMMQIVVLALGAGGWAMADDAAGFFDDSSVKEIRLYFNDANWYNTLLAGHRTAADPYYPCRFQYGATTISQIGCRFKGNSSFNRNGIKKPFKLDFNEYDENVTFLGLKKLNLNNFDLSPDFMREKLLHDMAGKYVTALRSVYVRLYVNDNFYGLYLAVEQPDKTMMQDRFGEKEDGNLYEAEERMGGGACDLSYLGASVASYSSRYLLETNEAANDYSGLIEFIQILNNTPTAELAGKLDPVADTEDWMTWMAINNIAVNLDSYLGVAAEYYLYDRSKDGKFIHIQWDHNESFGITGDGTPRLSSPQTTDPFYLPSATAVRPLLTKMWAVDAYRRLYLQAMARVVRGSFNPTVMNARVDQLAAMIRSHVNEDPNKAYTAAQFETNLTGSVGNIPGIRNFVNARYEYLRNYLNGQTAAQDIRLNEIVAVNGGGQRDEAGDADPWVEIHNLGPGTITLNDYYLTDDPASPQKWRIPARTLADGEHLVIWLDNETAEGETHANFRPEATGGRVYLYATAGGANAIDTVTYGAGVAGTSWMRRGFYGSNWVLTGTVTPGAVNVATEVDTRPAGTGLLRINELMADNKTTLADPQEAGAYEDWFEIYNPGTAAVDMTGMYLTDDTSNPTKYRIPAGVVVPAKGYVVFWADNDTGQGANHVNFALDADGERIYLYGTDGTTLIDAVTFATQQEDVALARTSDGGDTWAIAKPASPGATNANVMAEWLISAASARPGPVAAGSIVSAYGSGFAAGTVSTPSTTVPATLSGLNVTVVDSANVSHTAGLYFVSPGQVNFLMPDGVANGRARVTIRKESGATVSGDVLVMKAVPGLFSVTANGQGIGLIAATRVHTATNQQTAVSLYSYNATTQQFEAIPLAVNSTTERVYLTVYASGVKNETTLSNVKAQVGDVDVAVLYAGAQNEYPGLDQINLGPLPTSLAGKGSVDVELTVNGARANRVKITIQ